MTVKFLKQSFRIEQDLMHNTKHLLKTLEDKLSNSEVGQKSSQIEIFCPFTNERLKTSNCYKCKFCQKFEGKHQSGRTLTSLICIYGQENGSEEEE